MKAKFATIGLSLALVLGAAAPASAVTVAELQAQINALMSQLASLQGSSVSTGTTFTMDLTIGSTGAQVSALQQLLVSQGHLTMPAGVSMGYFGALTKSAVMKWQAAVGLPSTGFFGPMSRAKLNTSATTTVPGTTVGSTTGISTPGVEGTLTATLAPVPGSSTTVREGDMKKAVLGVELEAKLSDIKIERVKIKLDQTTGGTSDKKFYRDIADRMYVMDGSTVLASVDLNSDTVVEETSGEYYVTITGLNYVIRKDTKKTLTIAIDAQDSIDSTLLDGDTWTVTIPNSGIRGTDGAGVNQYSSANATYARTFETKAASSESASLTVSVSGSSPLTGEVIASNGSDEDELDGLTLVAFDAKAEDDDVTITDVTATISNSGSATTTTAYLFVGSTQIGSASVSGTSAVFDDIDYTIDENSTKTITLKVDVRDAATSATTFSISAVSITAENSEGDAASVSGSVSGNTLTVRKVGPQFTLVSKSISKSATSNQNNTSTSTVSADFVVRITAVGGDLYFGSQSASSTFGFQTYVGGSATTLLVASSTSYDVPSSGAGVVTAGMTGANQFKLQEGASIDLPAHFIFEGRTTAGALVSTNTYAVGLQSITWSRTGNDSSSSTFMAGRTEWRTSTVTLP